jgi:hypothetical protein
MESNFDTNELSGSFRKSISIIFKRLIIALTWLLVIVFPPFFFVLIVMAAVRSNKGLEDHIEPEMETQPERQNKKFFNFRNHSEVDHYDEIRSLRQENQALRDACQQYENIIRDQGINPEKRYQQNQN